jgi:Transposase IS116/IS110/IS902 family
MDAGRSDAGQAIVPGPGCAARGTSRTSVSLSAVTRPISRETSRYPWALTVSNAYPVGACTVNVPSAPGLRDDAGYGTCLRDDVGYGNRSGGYRLLRRGGDNTVQRRGRGRGLPAGRGGAIGRSRIVGRPAMDVDVRAGRRRAGVVGALVVRRAAAATVVGRARIAGHAVGFAAALLGGAGLAAAVGAFIGFNPKRDQSGDSDKQLGITKTGDSFMRRLAVGSANYMLGPFGQSSDLRSWGLELAKRGGKNAKKRATVAVARKLVVLMHRLWVTGEIYEPLGYREKRLAVA